jgi:hypothetical protein
VPFVFWGIDVGFSAIGYAARVKPAGLPFWPQHTKISAGSVARTRTSSPVAGRTAAGSAGGTAHRAAGTTAQSYIRNELMNQRSALGYRVSDADVLKGVRGQS